MHFIRLRLSSVDKRTTSTAGSLITCGNKRDMAAARGRKVPSKLGLAVKGKTFRVAAYYTARKGKTAPLCSVTSVMHGLPPAAGCRNDSQGMNRSRCAVTMSVGTREAGSAARDLFLQSALCVPSVNLARSSGRSPSLNEFPGRFLGCRGTQATPRASRVFHPATTANREAFPVLQVGAKAREAHCATPAARSAKVAALLF